MNFFKTVVDCVAVSEQWGADLKKLRLILNATDFDEEVKWGAPLKDDKKVLVNAQASVVGRICCCLRCRVYRVRKSVALPIPLSSGVTENGSQVDRAWCAAWLAISIDITISVNRGNTPKVRIQYFRALRKKALFDQVDHALRRLTLVYRVRHHSFEACT